MTSPTCFRAAMLGFFLVACAPAPDGTETTLSTSDGAQYGFESGAQSWSGSGIVSGVSPSTAIVYAGRQSLAVKIAASSAATNAAFVATPGAPAGAVVTFHVYVPARSHLSSVQPYVQQGAAGGWTWTGNWQPISALKAGAWNTLTVTVPADATLPLYQLGVEFSTSRSWSGTAYLDSIGWPAPSSSPDLATSPPGDMAQPNATHDLAQTTSCLATPLLTSLGRNHLLVGFSGDDSVATQASFDLRYEYLSGGIFDSAAPCTSCASGCTSNGSSCANSNPNGCGWWGCWQWDQDPPGQYARDFIAKAKTNGEIPMFTYYEILQASGASEGAGEVAAAQNVSFMSRYWADFRFLLQQIGSSTAFVHVEPDFWGYAEQANADPHVTPAAVASANGTDCAGLENSIAGMGRCFIAMARKYAPNAKIGLHASDWSTSIDVLLNTSTSLDVAGEAAKTSAFLAACGSGGSDFVAVDYSDRDAGYYQSIGRDTWWDATNTKLPDFTQAMTWTSAIATSSGKPVVVWQIPVGNMALGNVCNQYQDNRVDYLFGHMLDVAQAHVVGLAFGAGAGCQTTPSSDNGNLVHRVQTLTAAGGQSACP